MSKKLNSMPDYQARMPRFQHDLSQATMFTAAPSMLLPCYYHMLHLGDRLSFQQDLSCRLNPIMKPSVAPIDLHVDYFFVPLSVIYLPALNLFYQTDDLVSGIFNEKDAGNNFLKNQRFPLMDYSTALKNINTDPNDKQIYAGLQYPTTSFDCCGKAAYRLCDLLDLSPADLFLDETQTTKCNPVSTPWFLCAYHAIYENYQAYRNTDREKRSYKYNIDKWYASASNIVDPELFALHYVDAYKDYFNSIKVSPVGASISMLGSNTGQSNPWELLSKINSFLFDGSYSPSDSVGYADINQLSDFALTSVRGTSSSAPDNASLALRSFTSANLRQIFMLDKLLRVVGRADKNYESQFLAHFGVKVPHDVLHNITHLGHDMLTLDPTPTISTADTYSSASGIGSSLGEVGGQGYIRGLGRKRHFEAPCHGVFMAVFHAIPRYRYYAGISKLHDLSSPDKFWQPEFDRKGMQPLFSYEVYRPAPLYGFSDLNERLGWQFAYEQFKRKYDRVTRAFSNQGNAISTPATNSYAPWVLNKVPFFTTDLNTFAPISGEASPTIFTSSSYNALSFKALATDLNVLMEVPYQTTWISNLSYADAHSLFYTDPLILDYRLTMKVSNFMSETGEPELGD